MKVAFILNRLNDNKAMAPVIHEALGRGWPVELWLNHRDISKTTKYFEFPALESLPDYKASRRPLIRTFTSPRELEKLVSDHLPPFIFNSGIIPIDKSRYPSKWALIASCFHDEICGIPAAELRKYDVYFLNTPHWIEASIRFYEITGELKRGSELERYFRSTWVATGTGQFEHFPYCDRSATRKQLGVADHDKIITVFAFETSSTFWPQRIFLEHSRWRRIWSWLTLPASYPYFFSKIGKKKLFRLIWKSLADRLVYLPHLNGASEVDVLRKLRAFADRNGCKILVKARKKHPLPQYYFDNLAHVMVNEDRDFFPFTSAQLMHASDLVVTLYSTAGPEAAAGGTFVLNLTPPDRRFHFVDQYLLLRMDTAYERGYADLELFSNPDEGGLFQFKGLTECWDVNRFVKEIESTPLSRFQVDKSAHERYFRKFIRESAPGCAKQILDHLSRLVENKDR